jgi:hypothetical protein
MAETRVTLDGPIDLMQIRPLLVGTTLTVVDLVPGALTIKFPNGAKLEISVVGDEERGECGPGLSDFLGWWVE